MLHFDDLSLLTIDEEEIHPGLIKRTIEVTNGRISVTALKVTVENEDGDEEELVHKVTHLHLTSWPDHGVSWKYKVQGSRCIKYKVDYKFIICPDFSYHINCQ